MPDSTLTLDEFAPTSQAEWRAAAEESLKGAPFEKKLLTPTPEGVTLQPIYSQEDFERLNLPEAWPGIAPHLRGAHAAPSRCLVAQEIPFTDPAAFHGALRAACARGQNAVVVEMARGPRTAAEFSRAFEGVEDVFVIALAGSSALPHAAMVSAHSPALRGIFLADPLREYAVCGRCEMALDDALSEMAAVVRWAQDRPIRAIGVRAGHWGEAGATAVDEIAFAIATAVEYLRALTDHGIPPALAAGQVAFSLSLDARIFPQIAKLRALRRIWARVQDALGLPVVPAHIHVRSARFNKSALDAHTNMLRATAEAFAGIIGGADSMHVAAYDECFRTPDEFSRRIARNVHTVLNEECGFDRVADAAGGSWFVESLSAEFATRAWAAFQQVERLGGMKAALQAGHPQGVAQRAGQARLDAMASRRQAMIGVNLFPNIADELPDAPETSAEPPEPQTAASSAQKIERSVAAAAAALAAGASLDELAARLPRSVAVDPEIERIAPRRAAAGYEALRRTAQAHREKSGALPQVWLANFGTPKQHKARSDFAAGFFAAGGFDVRQGAGATSVEEAVAQAVAAAAPVVVLCSTDETYPEIVPPFAKALKAARPDVRLLLAGHPPDQIDAHRAAGIDDFIHIRLNCLDFLGTLQAQLGLSS